jgi:hypothetical protein
MHPLAVQDVWNAPRPQHQGVGDEEVREVPSLQELTATCRDFPPGFRRPREGEDDSDDDSCGDAPGALMGSVIGSVV